MLQRGLFRPLIDLVIDTELHGICCPPQVVVVTHNALRVDDHAGGQEQGTTRHREVQPHFGCLYSVLILDWTARHVQSLQSVLDEDKEIRLRVSRSSEGAKNTATRVGLCPQDAVTESLDGTVDPAKTVQCEPAGLVWYEVLELFVRALVVSYESDSVVDRGSTITLEPLTGGVRQVSRRVFPLLGAKGPSEYIMFTYPSPWFCPWVKRKSVLGSIPNSAQIRL